MSTELLFNSVACNIACTYCMQGFQRDAGNENPDGGAYDLDAMLATAKRVGDKSVTLFGGEPLLLGVNDLERVFERLHAQGTSIGIQSNVSLVTSRHIDLFKKYRVGVGASIDGPGAQNDARRAKSPDIAATRATTLKSVTNLERMLDEGISVSLIVTVHDLNAGTDERLDTLIAWLLSLRDRGLKSINLHTLEADGEGAALKLTDERSIDAMRRLRRDLVGFQHVSPFSDMRSKLLQEGQANCVWNACDPMTTPAVQGISPTGHLHNCSRTYKDGVPWLKGDGAPQHHRHIALYLTPQEHGGCQGCRWWLACTGGCPGESEDHDDRRRTYHCAMIKALMADIERDLFMEGKEPVSMSLRRPALEAQLLAKWTGNTMPSGDTTGNRPHLDHTDAERPVIIDASGRRIQ